MEEPFDSQAMIERAGELARVVRKSDVYPALIGGVAGGVAGALMAVIIAGRMSSRRAIVEEAVQESKKDRNEGWSMRELVQLATIAASLAKQAQEWYASRKEEKA